MNFEALLQKIRDDVPACEILENEPMHRHTAFRIGGAVRALLMPKSTADFLKVYELASSLKSAPLIIGNGSNLLVTDEFMDRIIIKTTNMSAVTLLDANTLRADCGILLSKLAVFAKNSSLAGLEFAHGIPGTLGGAVFMNAGAYGGEIKDVVTNVTAFSGGVVEVYDNTQCDFAYRHSRFSASDEIVLSANITLTHGEEAEIAKKMAELSEKRQASQPLNMPSAGSTFKRPKSGYAAQMIEEAGLKGYTVGGAQVSEKHAGFVVNRGGATFADVLALMEYVENTVEAKFAVRLEPEVRILR